MSASGIRSPQVFTPGSGSDFRLTGVRECGWLPLWSRFGQRQPVFAVGGVNLVRLVAQCENFVRVVKGHVLMGMARHTGFGAHFSHPLFDLLAEGVRIRVEMELHRGRLADEALKFRYGIPLTDDQPTINRLKIPRQCLEAATQKMLAFWTGPMMATGPIAEDIDRHHR